MAKADRFLFEMSRLVAQGTRFGQSLHSLVMRWLFHGAWLGNKPCFVSSKSRNERASKVLPPIRIVHDAVLLESRSCIPDKQQLGEGGMDGETGPLERGVGFPGHVPTHFRSGEGEELSLAQLCIVCIVEQVGSAV